MILEIVSFLGTFAGGNIFGHLGSWLQGCQERRTDRDEYKFKERLADKQQLNEYMEILSKQQPDGSYSPMVWCVIFVIILCTVSYCAATLSFFFWNPTEVMYTKDPTQEGRTVEIFFGFIKWDLSNYRILAMSRAGVGFLMCYPIIFIISMVVRGEKPKRIR